METLAGQKCEYLKQTRGTSRYNRAVASRALQNNRTNNPRMATMIHWRREKTLAKKKRLRDAAAPVRPDAHAHEGEN